jgi:xanthine dehydrogenase accessory factor
MGMSDHPHMVSRHLPPNPFAVILGTNEIASAIAVYLSRSGWGVALSHDPSPPVFRRGMTFYDALFGDHAAILEVFGQRAETGLEVLSVIARPNTVVVTPLGLLDLLVLRRLDLVVDARLQALAPKPDFRNLAHITIGLGAGFQSSVNCDIALLGASWGCAQSMRGALALTGNDLPAASQGFLCAERRGLWRTAVDLGSRAFRGFVVGHVDALPTALRLTEFWSEWRGTEPK